MYLFIVLSEAPIDDGDIEHWQQLAVGTATYKLTPSAVLLRTPLNSPRIIAAHVGMAESDAADPRRGVVLKLNGTYYGYFRKNLWEWLAESREGIA